MGANSSQAVEASASRASHDKPAAVLLQRKCECGTHTIGGGACGDCEEKARRLQRRAARAGEVSHGASASGAVGDVLRSHGSPLDASTRTFMESRFGHDFSGVRVHTDAGAQESARSLNALAYTVGRDIAFGAGRYAPASVEGRRLIAHELAHVVQQSSSNSALSTKSDGVTAEDSASEREADAAADSVLSHRPVPALRPVTAGVLSRKADGQGADAGGRGSECPQTFVIPADVYAAIEEAWGKSGHGTAKAIEHGGRIVTDRHGEPDIRKGSGTSYAMDPKNPKHYPREPGDVTRGSLHTHPYESGRLGMTFSDGDVETLIDGFGQVMYVGAGSCYFILNTVNHARRDACRKLNIRRRYEKANEAARGTLQQTSEAAVKATIRGCGLCYYKTCRTDFSSPVPPQTATLVQDG